MTPVLTFAEAAHHPHLAHRGTYLLADDMTKAALAPRFSGTTSAPGREDQPAVTIAEVLAPWTSPHCTEE